MKEHVKIHECQIFITKFRFDINSASFNNFDLAMIDRSEDKEHNKCRRIVSKFSISPLFMSILLGLILVALLVNDFVCYRKDTCMPSKTTYRIQFIVYIAHLTAIGLFLFAYVHATEIKLHVQKILSIVTGTFNFVLLISRTIVELLYIDYHPENYLKD
jgi:hypothetical protein